MRMRGNACAAFIRKWRRKATPTLRTPALPRRRGRERPWRHGPTTHTPRSGSARNTRIYPRDLGSENACMHAAAAAYLYINRLSRCPRARARARAGSSGSEMKPAKSCVSWHGSASARINEYVQACIAIINLPLLEPLPFLTLPYVYAYRPTCHGCRRGRAVVDRSAPWVASLVIIAQRPAAARSAAHRRILVAHLPKCIEPALDDARKDVGGVEESVAC